MPFPAKANIAVFLTHPEVEGWNFRQRHADLLLAAFPDATVSIAADEAQFVQHLADADVVLTWRFRQEWFAHAPRLRLLVTPAAGRDFLDNIVPPDNVLVRFSAFHGELMAETAVGMILGVLRGVLPAQALQNGADPWSRRELAARMRPLRGAHVMLAGFGNIGRWCGKLLKPFGVRLTGVARRRFDRPEFFDEADRIIPAAAVNAELPGVDALLLCLPGGGETDNWLGAQRIALLPAHALVVNIGRGNALDEQALIAALRADRLGAACLDVFRLEPLPADSPLRTCPRCYLMPHASAIAPNYLDLFVRELAGWGKSGESRDSK